MFEEPKSWTGKTSGLISYPVVIASAGAGAVLLVGTSLGFFYRRKRRAAMTELASINLDDSDSDGQITPVGASTGLLVPDTEDDSIGETPMILHAKTQALVNRWGEASLALIGDAKDFGSVVTSPISNKRIYGYVNTI